MPTKGKSWSWTPEALERRRSKFKAAPKSVEVLPPESGDPPGGDGGDPPGGDQPGSSTRGKNRGGRNLTGGPGSSTNEKEKPKPNVDLPKLKAGLPWFLKKLNLTLDGLARFISGSDKIKVDVYFEKLEDTEAQMDAEFLWPYCEYAVPEWLQKHPLMAVFFVFVANTFGKVRWKAKPKKEEANDTAKPGLPSGQ